MVATTRRSDARARKLGLVPAWTRSPTIWSETQPSHETASVAGDVSEWVSGPVLASAGGVRAARAKGVALTGPDGPLEALTKTVIETALEEEMSEHLGYDKHEPVGRNRGNSRNGKRAKTVLSDACGEVDIEVPRDREGSFEPVVVKKRQRRLSAVDEVVLSLYAKGLTPGRSVRTSPRSTAPRCPADQLDTASPDHQPGDRGNAGQ